MTYLGSHNSGELFITEILLYIIQCSYQCNLNEMEIYKFILLEINEIHVNLCHTLANNGPQKVYKYSASDMYCVDNYYNIDITHTDL